MDDKTTPSEPMVETSAQATEPVPAPIGSESSQSNGSTPTDLPPEAPESPISDVPHTPVPLKTVETRKTL